LVVDTFAIRAAFDRRRSAGPIIWAPYVMLEALRAEIAAELAIDPNKQVAIERGRDAGRVVVGRIEDLGRLDSVDADDQHGATVQILAIVASRADRGHALLGHLLA
jgi:hypothetical protein